MTFLKHSGEFRKKRLSERYAKSNHFFRAIVEILRSAVVVKTDEPIEPGYLNLLLIVYFILLTISWYFKLKKEKK